MLTVALAMTAAHPTASSAASGTNAEIVVLAQRIKQLKFKLKRDNRTGAGLCHISKSSGDTELDQLACNAAVSCMGKQKLNGDVFLACLKPRWTEIVRDLALRRKAQVNAH